MPSNPYKLTYSEEAIKDLQTKAMYIFQITGNFQVAQQWESRLRQKIRKTIPFFPHKFPIYGEYKNINVRFWPYHNDVVFYICDDDSCTVTIITIATAGQDLEELLNQHFQEPAP